MNLLAPSLQSILLFDHTLMPLVHGQGVNTKPTLHLNQDVRNIQPRTKQMQTEDGFDSILTNSVKTP